MKNLAVIVAAMVAGGCSTGGSEATERALAAEIQYQNRESDRYAAEVSALREEILRQFDADGDGRLTGQEQKSFERYLLSVRSGKVKNPFEAINTPGAGPR